MVPKCSDYEVAVASFTNPCMCYHMANGCPHMAKFVLLLGHGHPATAREEGIGKEYDS